ncbi:hypothetical protein [Streptomyces sp. JB150]|uniref:hypothetical protein n=1 Tax=Streptomyces sp. JB150 TaxID=2714844 RepID=UPI001409B7AA|nr:hypothetical protein [Streptomyces sp. JB150]QIJ60683.1 hypothetical protein G7Z13_00515 [Streptomyces sp. JB150]
MTSFSAPGRRHLAKGALAGAAALPAGLAPASAAHDTPPALPTARRHRCCG